MIISTCVHVSISNCTHTHTHSDTNRINTQIKWHLFTDSILTWSVCCPLLSQMDICLKLMDHMCALFSIWFISLWPMSCHGLTSYISFLANDPSCVSHLRFILGTRPGILNLVCTLKSLSSPFTPLIQSISSIAHITYNNHDLQIAKGNNQITNCVLWETIKQTLHHS